MRSFTPGKLLISLVALFSAFGSYIFDWNKTHMFNPNWPPHAKFHNAQDMLMGTTTGLLALWVLWMQKVGARNKLGVSIVLASLYWLTQAGALLFPGTALMDPEFSRPGQPPAQLYIDIAMVALLTIAFLLENKRIKNGKA